VEYLQGFSYGQERLETGNQRVWTVTSFCLVSFMSLYVSLYFSSLFGFISSLPQLAWDKRLCCCYCFWVGQPNSLSKQNLHYMMIWSRSSINSREMGTKPPLVTQN
jgi:hypothetical protein